MPKRRNNADTFRPSRRTRGSNYPGRGWQLVRKAGNWAWKNRQTIGKASKVAWKGYKAWKGSKTKTATTTTKFKQAVQGTSQHNDTSSRYFRHTVRKGRKGVIQKLMRQKHHFKFTEDWTNIFTSLEGRQGFGFFKCIATRAQMLGSAGPFLRTGNTAALTSAANPFELNPYRVNSGSAIFAAGTTAIPMLNDKIYYKSVVGTCKVINMTTVATHVTIYWLMTKKDTFFGPNDVWQQAIDAEKMGTANAGPATLTTDPDATPGAPLNVNVGQNPFMYRHFKQYWRVLEKKVYYLQGGDEIDTNFKFEYNKLLDRSVINSMPNNTFIANYTIVPFVIFKGSLVGATVTSGDPPLPVFPSPEVTIGACRLGVYINQTHEYGPVPAELRTPTTHYFPGAVEGTNIEVQIDDTDQNDTVKVF